MGWEMAAAVVGGLLLVWLALVAGLVWASKGYEDAASLRDILRLVPDVIRLFRRLAADRSLPKGVRVRLGLLTAYLLLPFDLVPDFLPVVGHADDALVVVLALRSVVKAAGPEALDRHWPGSSRGLDNLKRLAGMTA